MRAFLGLALPVAISMILAKLVPVANDYIYFIGGCFSFGLMNFAIGNLKFAKQRAI